MRYAGAHLNRVRHRNRRLRHKLQHKGTKSAKRLLKKRSRKESRFAKDVNHCVSKSSWPRLSAPAGESPSKI